MFTAILITGGNTQERSSEVLKIIEKLLVKTTGKDLDRFYKSPDFISLVNSENSWSIDEIRKIESQIYLKPYSHAIKVIYLENADRMTIPAQNAFLKTLEEPPSYCQIILGTSQPQTLLPTIISRCQIIQIKSQNSFRLSREEKIDLEKQLEIITGDDIGEKFFLAEKWGSQKQDIKTLIDKLDLVIRERILSSYFDKTNNSINTVILQKYLSLLKNSLKIKRHIEANVNPRFALENLFLAC